MVEGYTWASGLAGVTQVKDTWVSKGMQGMEVEGSRQKGKWEGLAEESSMDCGKFCKGPVCGG